MKVIRLETFRLPPRWLFLRLETSDGLVGWGEPIVEGRIATTEAAVHELGSYLIDEPLRGIEDTWQLLTKGGFYRGGPVFSSAIAGIDQALWDIQGKRLNVPIHELLGGPVRDRIRIYGWVAGDEPSRLREEIAARVEAGYTAVKMNACGMTDLIDTQAKTNEILAGAHAAREALGSERDLLLDMHGRLSPAMAGRILPLLEEVHPLFVEEPSAPELAREVLPALVRSTSIPIAMGERFYSRGEFKGLLDAGVAVVQPDVSHAGGISETRRIAALAEIYGAALAIHCPLGPIALAASLQVDAASPNFLIQEHSLGIHYNTDFDVFDYVLDPAPLRPIDGYIETPTAPGLGVEVDEAAVRAASDPDLDWRAPVWRRLDGSLAEW